MKKTPLFTILALFTILFASITYVQAASLTPASNTAGATSTPSGMPSHVDYPLPYPGLLPDNPLYVIKVLRDKIVGFFISDPLKKAQFDLLQADKRLNTGIYLARESKNDDRDNRITDVVSKGENYFSEGLDNVRKAQEQGEITSPVTGIMQVSLTKHEEVILQLEGQVGPAAKDQLAREAQRVVQFESEVASLSHH